MLMFERDKTETKHNVTSKKIINLRFADTTQEMINTHCGTRLLTDSTSYFHLKSLWAPYSQAGSKSPKHETILSQNCKGKCEALGNQLASPKQLPWLP